ncbi:unnamed protein product, partial [Prorocentrum cordatum]
VSCIGSRSWLCWLLPGRASVLQLAPARHALKRQAGGHGAQPRRSRCAAPKPGGQLACAAHVGPPALPAVRLRLGSMTNVPLGRGGWHYEMGYRICVSGMGGNVSKTQMQSAFGEFGHIIR